MPSPTTHLAGLLAHAQCGILGEEIEVRGVREGWGDRERARAKQGPPGF